jgi:hypothetical protein
MTDYECWKIINSEMSGRPPVVSIYCQAGARRSQRNTEIRKWRNEIIKKIRVKALEYFSKS